MTKEQALLRRYLRAVVGDQSIGDRLATALTASIEPSKRGAPRSEAEVLCLAMRRWRQLHGAAERAAPFTPAAIAQAVPPTRALSRQVGILTDVFGLTVGEIGTALDRSAGEVTVLLSGSRAEAAAPIGLSVLIVEDDPVVSRHLMKIAERAGARRVDSAASAQAAYDAADAHPPDIVVCDYDLGSGPNGAAVVSSLTAAHDCVSIFVTAHPDGVLSGTDGEPAFIIGKPFSVSVVRAALSYASTAERPALLAA